MCYFQGEHFGTTEATEAFFAMTRLFQSNDVSTQWLMISVSLVLAGFTVITKQFQALGRERGKHFSEQVQWANHLLEAIPHLETNDWIITCSYFCRLVLVVYLFIFSWAEFLLWKIWTITESLVYKSVEFCGWFLCLRIIHTCLVLWIKLTTCLWIRYFYSLEWPGLLYLWISLQ